MSAGPESNDYRNRKTIHGDDDVVKALTSSIGLLLALLGFGACAGAGSPPPQTASTTPAATTSTAPSDESPTTVAEPSADTEGNVPTVESLEPLAEATDVEPGEYTEAPNPVADDVPTDRAAVLEDSLETYESSETFWQEGDFEDALAALDRAYELMASVPDGDDPYLAQQKADLRRLISRRIVEIYASRQVAVGDVNDSIPRIVNEEVEREIASFQGRERQFFLESYRRSGLWRPMILEELRSAGLPEQLSWLPLVESGFKVRALSRARALGLWQFISSTGTRYGLDRDNWVDERMDPVKATRAAIGYLSDLHALFGDWLTALAAYNCGEGNVLRQIRNQQVSYFDQFWDIYGRLPRETRRYVPRFLATLAILEDPAAYGFDLPEPLPRARVEVAEVSRPIELAALDRALDLQSGTLAALNPELRWGATPKEPYSLRVPEGRAGTVSSQVAQVPEFIPREARTVVHRVRRGETLSQIASRYGTSVRALMQNNRLRSANRIYPGQRLQVSSGGGGASSSRVASRGGTYTVRRGDTLGGVARRHGVSLGRLLAVNNLSTRSTIYPGQRLTIP